MARAQRGRVEPHLAPGRPEGRGAVPQLRWTAQLAQPPTRNRQCYFSEYPETLEARTCRDLDETLRKIPPSECIRL